MSKQRHTQLVGYYDEDLERLKKANTAIMEKYSKFTNEELTPNQRTMYALSKAMEKLSLEPFGERPATPPAIKEYPKTHFLAPLEDKIKAKRETDMQSRINKRMERQKEADRQENARKAGKKQQKELAKVLQDAQKCIRK